MHSDPLWMADQITYQIFPDRFAIGKPHTSETKLKLPEYHIGDMTTRRWDELPENPSRGKDFFGGDLAGICDKLDYIQDLGATCVYLTPIFISPSNHKYDTTDFFTVEPQFGGEAALRRLISELKRRKMRLILDAVFNHVSDTHPWHPKYTTGEYWRGFHGMPELDLANPELREILLSVLKKYNDMGVDGWRFDVAVDVGLPFVRAMRERFPDAVLLGEVMCFAGEWCRGFTGVMNYYFRDAVLGWLRDEVSTRQVQHVASDYATGYGHTGATCSWNMLSSHDTPRLRNTIQDSALRKLAIVAQFTLPGVPFIYYGEEIGMDGAGDPDCRRPMIWDEKRWDRDTLAFYKKLIEIRQSHAALRTGKMTMLESDALVFLRHADKLNETAIVAINNSTQPYRQIVFTPHSHLYHALPMRNLLDPSQTVAMEAGNIKIELPARSAGIFVPDDTRIPNYRFFKARNLAA
jgi:glycosidase